MKIRLRNHNYETRVCFKLKHYLTGRNAYATWFIHGDGCCDYWTPISDPRAQRALMLDDDLGLSPTTKNKEERDE